jgi:phosphatidylglycerophosphate synthase
MTDLHVESKPDPETPSPAAPVRRPISFRGTRLAVVIAKALAATEVAPNTISFAGPVFSFIGCAALGYVRSTSSPGAAAALLLVGALMILFRGCCNVFDGMVAIEHGRRTKSGELYNELPDRFSDVFTLVGAGLVAPVNLGLGWTAAALAIITAYVRALSGAMGAGQHFIGPMQKTHRMAVIATALVASAILTLLGQSVRWVMFVALAVVIVGCLITIVVRARKIIDVVETA